MTRFLSDAVTSLDVLENFFGAVPNSKQIMSLSNNDIQELRDRMMEFSSADESEPVPENSIYPGAGIAGSWQWDVARPQLNQCLLYQDSIVTHDPVADYFGMSERWMPQFRIVHQSDGAIYGRNDPGYWAPGTYYESTRNDPQSVRRFLANLIPYIFELGPMIKSRVIVPRPQWKTFRKHHHAMLSSAKDDVHSPAMTHGAPRITDWGVLATSDISSGFPAKLRPAYKPSDDKWQWESEFFHLAKQLAFSDQFSTIYVPHSAADLELLKLKVGTLGPVQQNQPSTSVLDEVTRVVLPGLNLSAPTAVEIRKDNESFEAWRKTIRKIDRDSKNDDPLTLRQRVEDELSTVKEQIERQAFSTVLKEHATRGGLGAAFTSIGQMGLEYMVNGESNSVLAFGAGAIGWIGGAYLFPSARGAGRVMVSLQKSEETPGNINWWR